MKTEDKNAVRLSKRGNVLDTAIILLLVAALAAIGYRYFRLHRSVGANEEIRMVMTFEVENVEATRLNFISEDDVVFADGTEERIGTLNRHPGATGVSPFATQSARVTLTDADGAPVTVEVPDASRLDATGQLTCLGILHDTGVFYLNGTTVISPGQRIHVHTERASFVLTVQSLEQVQE